MMFDWKPVSASLLSWFKTHQRTLPWRSEPTPYHILLSELMCQQTRIDTVLPYFSRFTERWPTLEAFASEEEEDIVEAWAGLGYYSRARNLHRCAVTAVEMGGLPSTAHELKKLPGIGPYTAGAIASIAFGERAPLVDGNVERVLSRLTGFTEDPRTPTGKRQIWAYADQLMSVLPTSEHPGDLNQAVMELGALICLPKNRAQCADCPVESSCGAVKQDIVSTLPAKRPRKKPVPIQGVSLVVMHGEHVAMGKRTAGQRLAGLWEPPHASTDPRQDPSVVAQDMLEQLIGTTETPWSLGTVTHVFTHRKLTTHVFLLQVRETEPLGALDRYDRLEWRRLSDGGTSSLATKVLSLADTAPLLAAQPLKRIR